MSGEEHGGAVLVGFLDSCPHVGDMSNNGGVTEPIIYGMGMTRSRWVTQPGVEADEEKKPSTKSLRKARPVGYGRYQELEGKRC